MSEPVYHEIKDRYLSVLERIANAARSVNRSPDEIRLVVVTKGHSLEKTRAVVVAGAKILGENYVEEAVPKIKDMANLGVKWHMIGHIQSRKAQQVCENFSYVHSLDRIKVARRLDRFADEINIQLPVLLECNLSGEESKFGFHVWEEALWSKFSEDVEVILGFPNLVVHGLMTMPPWNSDAEASRSYFQQINRLQNYLSGLFPETDWKELSFGMSNDFEVAIQEGATFVRVGTAILGPRN